MENNIHHISRPRKIDYYQDLISDQITELIYEGLNYEAYKLQIKQRHIQTVVGEVNFLIRDKSNNLKYILVYCYMMEPENIFKIEYYINDTIQLPTEEVVSLKSFLDREVAEMLVKDLIVNYISKNYRII
jgi:hypothetical protein